MWLLQKVPIRLTCDLFALFIRQSDNISTDTNLRVSLSAITEPVLHITSKATEQTALSLKTVVLTFAFI